MRVVLAASIFPPEIGGPATYAAGLKASLEKMGHTVEVELFSALTAYPSGIRHAIYTYRLIRAARSADLIIAFDVLTTGLPVAVAHRVTKVRAIARIGGDFIWERYIERTGALVPLPEFYSHWSRWGVREQILMLFTKFVLGSIDVAFSSSWQRDIWNRPYRLNISRTHVIENAIPARIAGERASARNFLHYGRQLKLKNSEMLRTAFETVKKTHAGIILEEGMLPHEELLERMKKAYAVVLPSVSDVTPNYIIDAIVRGKPFLLTRYSAYAEKFKELGVFIEPMSHDDIVHALERLLEPTEYQMLCERIAAFTEVRTYDDIAKEFLAAI